MKKDAFYGLHPLVIFLYFAFVILFSMFFMHPICLVLSFVASFIYSIYLKGKKTWKFNILFLLPMMLVSALINPAFNHEGVTVLAYFSNGNALTLESVIYGLSSGVMIGTVILWFSCSNVILTSDKIMFLFGKIAPSLSLLFSMTLRFVPKFKAQIKIVSNAQKCVGKDAFSGKLINRVKNGINILSIMVSWSLENAVETADSMKSRGYGLKGRTAFSNYRFDSRDQAVLVIMLYFILYVIVGVVNGGLYFRYFPSFKQAPISFYNSSVFVVYFMLLTMPVTMNLLEEIKWKSIRSKI